MKSFHIAFVSQQRSYLRFAKGILAKVIVVNKAVAEEGEIQNDSVKVDCFESSEEVYRAIQLAPQKYFALVSGFYLDSCDGFALMAKLKKQDFFGVRHRVIHSYFVGSVNFNYSQKINGIGGKDVVLIKKTDSMKPLLDYFQQILNA